MVREGGRGQVKCFRYTKTIREVKEITDILQHQRYGGTWQKERTDMVTTYREEQTINSSAPIKRRHKGTPGNHLFLFVGGMASTAQNLGRSREEVKAVVLEILIDEWQENLEKAREN